MAKLLTIVPTNELKTSMRGLGKAAGAKIRKLRTEAGIGPTEFCAGLGIPLQTLHKIETGEIIPRDHLKAALAIRLQVELDELYPWPTAEELVEDVRNRQGKTPTELAARVALRREQGAA